MSGPDTEVDHHPSVTLYSPGRLVRLLHRVPHVNISLHRLEDPSFRPDTDPYLESLGIMGSVPLACLLLTLITLTTYLLTRFWCYRDTNDRNVKDRRSRPDWCNISIFALVCCLPLGVGFYGNKELKAGIEGVTQSMVNMDRLVKTGEVI